LLALASHPAARYHTVSVKPGRGPLMVLWIRGMPESQHPDLRDRAGFSTDILERWRGRLTQAGLMKPGWRWIDRKPRR
jgi:hypothetical protein